MKKKYAYFGAAVLVLLIMLIASIPRITSQKRISFDDVMNGACPQLAEAYQTQSESYELVPVEEAEIVTVSTIWGSVDFFILPCVYSHVDTVPENGQTHWYTRLCIIQACSDENALTARLCRVGVENIHVFASAGEHTMISSKADIYPGGKYEDISNEISIDDVPDCAVTPAVGVSFLASTAGSAEESNEQSMAHFIWDFDVTICGKVIHSCRDFMVEYEYINNV